MWIAAANSSDCDDNGFTHFGPARNASAVRLRHKLRYYAPRHRASGSTTATGAIRYSLWKT